MIIRIERSGGVVGSSVSAEIDTKNLPPGLKTTAKKIMMDQRLSTLPKTGPPRGATDYFIYKISIQDGINRKVIECNEYTIQHDLKQLVKFIEGNSKKRK